MQSRYKQELEESFVDTKAQLVATIECVGKQQMRGRVGVRVRMMMQLL